MQEDYLQLNNFLFFIHIFSVRSWSMISSTIKTYLKTYLKRKKDKDKNYEEEKRLKFFESLNDNTDFLLWNSEQWTGEWLLLRKLFGTFFTSKWLFSWISVRWVLRLPDSENDLEHSLQGRGRRFFLKMASPRKWLLLGYNFSPGN